MLAVSHCKPAKSNSACQQQFSGSTTWEQLKTSIAGVVERVQDWPTTMGINLALSRSDNRHPTPQSTPPPPSPSHQHQQHPGWEPGRRKAGHFAFPSANDFFLATRPNLSPFSGVRKTLNILHAAFPIFLAFSSLTLQYFPPPGVSPEHQNSFSLKRP